MPRKFEFHLTLTVISSTSRNALCEFVIVSRSLLLRVRNISDKIIEKNKKHFMFNNVFPKIVSFFK